MTNGTRSEVVLHDPERGGWLSFANPVKVIEVHHAKDLLPALDAIREAVESGGCHAAGFLAYEAAPAFDTALIVGQPDPGFPLAWFGLFPEPAFHTDLHGFPARGASPLPQWTPSISHDHYNSVLDRLRRYIHAGDTYQVNFTWRLRAPFDGDARAHFPPLVQAQGPHYSAFVQTGRFSLCSASPELFFRLEGETLSSRPMKGTIARGRTPVEDLRQSQALQESAKNRAENVMIVDMIRNDLGRIATPGSVRPARLFDVERYPTVWQMTSTVECRTHASFPEIMAALFPCASITGAPKPRTMAIIAELEDSPRKIYTGTIGYLAPGRKAQFNVAIRTILVDHASRTAEYGVGGGIVWDSVSRDEYEECLLKAAVLQPAPDFELLETMLWNRTEGFYLLDRHLDRLLRSAGYFGIPGKRDTLLATLRAWETGHAALPAEERLRVRLLVDQQGAARLESAPLIPRATPLRVALAPAPVDPANRFLYHKTTLRHVYDSAKSACPGADDVLLWNPAGGLTESTIANLVVELDGEKVTPPVECGLLPGTFREELLAQGVIRERVVHLKDLPRIRKMFLVNSVRQWEEAVLLK